MEWFRCLMRDLGWRWFWLWTNEDDWVEIYPGDDNWEEQECDGSCEPANADGTGVPAKMGEQE